MRRQDVAFAFHCIYKYTGAACSCVAEDKMSIKRRMVFADRR